jgi:hypothetical protein
MNWLRSLFGGDRKPGPTALATVQREAGNVYVLRIGGVINKATVDRIQEIATADLLRGAKDLKVLIVLTDFRGWRRGDDWGDIDFFAAHEKDIARIAVVGEAKWETETRMFLAAGQRSGEVRFFAPAQEAQARAWLTGLA